MASLSEYNGRSFFFLNAVHTERAFQLYNDCSKIIGYGAVLGDNWLYGTRPESWKAYIITFLELYPIVLSSILWGSHFSNRTIEFHTDNLAQVSIINKFSSGKPHIMSLVRALVLAMLRFNFVIYAIHVPGIQNVLPNALSHDQIGLFKWLHRHAAEHPSTIATSVAGRLMADVKDMLQRSLSPTTWSRYGKVWNDFERFASTILELLAVLLVLLF